MGTFLEECEGMEEKAVFDGQPPLYPNTRHPAPFAGYFKPSCPSCSSIPKTPQTPVQTKATLVPLTVRIGVVWEARACTCLPPTTLWAA